MYYVPILGFTISGIIFIASVNKSYGWLVYSEALFLRLSV